MNATTPTHCPHGAGFARPFSSFGVRFADGCWTTSAYMGEVRFWCGAGEASKLQGVSITEGEYLADWDLALVLNAGDDLYDEAVRLNSIHDGLGRLAEKYGQTLDICNWCGGLALLESGSCIACASDAAQYLGEVSWSDRVDD